MEKQYALAVSNMRARGNSDADVVAKLIAHLTTAGKLKLLPGIVRELTRMEYQAQKLAPHLEIARESDRERAQSAAEKAGVHAPRITLTPELISGWRLRSNGTLIDHSGKQALTKLYTVVTS